ncbi:MAG: serine hydrolase [Gammaproteobacteria bacterium]|nr:serine hydrolase [Gammaproteobacteria bacterium]
MVDGVCDERFGKVRDRFEAAFGRGDEVGASVAVAIEGEMVVDLWGGHRDAGRSRVWTRDSLVKVASTSKAITAFLAHVLMAEGRLDVDLPVARYWPEFAQAGKGEVRVRQLLSHTSGLCTWREPISFEDCADWAKVTGLLAGQAPLWTPGERNGYHMVTFGYLVGEVIRRITGTSVGGYLRDVGGLLDLDMHIGAGPELDARIADDVPDYGGQSAADVWGATDPESIAVKTFTNPPAPAQMTSAQRLRWRRMELPAGNAHTNARSIARMFAIYANAGMLDGARVLSPAVVAEAASVQSATVDAVFGIEAQFTLGFLRNQHGAVYGPNADAFGHSGTGGSFGCADPDCRLSMGYAPNRLLAGLAGDPRAIALIDAVYECLGRGAAVDGPRIR